MLAVAAALLLSMGHAQEGATQHRILQTANSASELAFESVLTAVQSMATTTEAIKLEDADSDLRFMHNTRLMEHRLASASPSPVLVSSSSFTAPNLVVLAKFLDQRLTNLTQQLGELRSSLFIPGELRLWAGVETNIPKGWAIANGRCYPFNDESVRPLLIAIGLLHTPNQKVGCEPLVDNADVCGKASASSSAGGSGKFESTPYGATVEKVSGTGRRFCVPDLRARVPLGAASDKASAKEASAPGATSDVSQVTLNVSHLPSHTHVHNASLSSSSASFLVTDNTATATRWVSTNSTPSTDAMGLVSTATVSVTAGLTGSGQPITIPPPPHVSMHWIIYVGSEFKYEPVKPRQ